MRDTDRVRVAAAQYPLDRIAQQDQWFEKMSAWVANGAATRAQLLVFPEYGALELAAAAGDDALASPSATLAASAGMLDAAWDHLGKLARRYDLHILAPSGPARDNGRFVNRARLISPTGASGVQDKLIMTPFERDWGVFPGRDLNVFETSLGRIGVAICYDSEFPLLVRSMAEAGAEMIVIPTCTEFISGYHRIRVAAAARALESQVVTITSPLVGEAPWCVAADRNTGAAGVFVPPEAGLSMSGVLVEGRLDEPGWISTEIDLGALRRVRSGGEMRNDRDWCMQPGAAPLTGYAKLVTLR